MKRKYKFIANKRLYNSQGIAIQMGKSRQWINEVLKGNYSVNRETAEKITKIICKDAKLNDFFKEDIPKW